MIGHRIVLLCSFAVVGVSLALFVGLVVMPCSANRPLSSDLRPPVGTPPNGTGSLAVAPLPPFPRQPGMIDRELATTPQSTLENRAAGEQPPAANQVALVAERAAAVAEPLALAPSVGVTAPLALASPWAATERQSVTSAVGLLGPPGSNQARQTSVALEVGAPSQALAAVHAVNIAPPPVPLGTISQSAADGNGEGDGNLEIHFPDADIAEVLEALSQQGNLNILASESVQGKVSVNLIGVDVESALDAILRSTRFIARREGKFIFVGTPEDFAAVEQSLDTIITRAYRPNYVTAMELQTLLQPLVTPEIGVVSVSSPSAVGIEADETSAGGDAFAGGEVLLIRDYQAVLTQIDQLIEEIDVRPMQVSIEAMILAIKLADDNSLGVSFDLLRNHPNVRFGLGTPLNTLPAALTNGGLQFAFIDSNLGTFLEALETITDTNVIATPRLMVLNKHRAEIQIGNSEGYVSSTVTETSTSQSIEFLDTGTLLRLRPFISSDGLIRMEIHPELSNGEVTLIGQFTIPKKEVTQVTTNVMVRDGGTVVIGGLIREQLVNSSTQVPLLGSLPWVGPLFRNKKEETNREEILVLITPRIVREPEACAEGSRVACEFQRRQAVNAEKFSPLGKRHIGRRYFRLAQDAMAAGDVDRALHNAEMAVHFDPSNNAAIELRSNIWRGVPTDPNLSPYPVTEESMTDPLNPAAIAPWPPDGLEVAPDSFPEPAHLDDPGQPGYHTEVTRPQIGP